ncbi:uncharacterized protein si:ch211-180a12.2 isoform X1 [Syngnathus acus]|uniref:uncharacterized protein si:ch211-180a12.2 isoform X1 n=1 Tax=Syngnathus acus TaxID=161584 RepID=UPI001886232C|nr:uncharacterized protein si:ch211-180a12.2 isoform X1 [Syngnathus acus]
MQFKVLVYVVLLHLINNVSSADIQAEANTNASLPCNVALKLDKVDEASIEVNWVRNGSVVASFKNATAWIDDNFFWTPGRFLSGDFSVSVLRVGLSLQGVYECTVRYNSTILDSSTVTLSVFAPPSVSVPPHQWLALGAEGQLECRADGFYPPPVTFTWTRDGQVIQPAEQLDGEKTPDGFYRAVANLTYYPTRWDQNTTFGCKVSHNGVDQELHFLLNITYSPTIRLSAVPSPSSNSPLTLSCNMESYYPEEMSVSWLQNGTVLPDPPDTEQNPDGTFRTTRYFTLSQEQRWRGGEVECAVNQPGVMNSARAAAYLEELDPQDKEPVLTKSAKASVALMCISLVLVFLLCFGFSWRRRDEKQKSLAVSGIILPPRIIVGQKGRVSVSIEGRRVERVQTTWFLNDTPISDTSLTVGSSRANFNCLYNPLTTIHLPYGLTLTSPAPEKGPLLPSRGETGYYKLHSQGPLYSTASGVQQLVSSLTFIPQISIHKGAVFKCQVAYAGKDKIVMERVSERFTVLSAPEVSEIQLAETRNNPGVVSMTVRASHFHPDVITFRWFCQGGELSPVASKASTSPRPNSEGFFTASSQCKLPRAEMEQGGTRVWVSVHHIALKQPVTRETRGFIKQPRVSDISSASSAPDQMLTLGCEITDFYPPDVTVTWLKVRGGEQDDSEDEVLEGSEMWGPVEIQPRLYRTTATLRTANNREKRQRGGGIKCRVEHISLQEPIERLWRNVDIVAPSIPSSISVCWSSEGVGVFSLLLKGGHPKVKLLWTAGGTTLSPLDSNETEEIGDDGQRELKSVCALERSTQVPGQSDKWRKIKTKAAVTYPDTDGIAYIDEKADGENNNDEEKYEETKSSDGEEASDDDVDDDEREEDSAALHINRVNLTDGSKGGERARLRVIVELTHPALKMPVYRSWTEPNEEISSM